MTRRLQHYDVPEWRPWLIIAGLGALLILGGVICQIIMLYVSIRDRDSERLRDRVGDPWDGRSLEWSTASPPPFFNFAVMPVVDEEEEYWAWKQAAAHRTTLRDEPDYKDIEMPRNSPTGFVTAFVATVMGFALIWHIWWLAGVAFLGAYATFVVFAWRDHDEYHVPVETLARADRENRAVRAEALKGYAPR
jgi:cytochrome o ubiquinol oxidase subunit 1